MHRVVSVSPQPEFKLQIRFEDGVVKHIDLKPFISEGVSARLAQWEYFEQVAIDDGGGIFWPNRYDFCPEFLRDYLSEMTPAQSN